MSYTELMSRSWSENRLVSVLVELTYRCNLDCFFCYNDLSLTGRPLSFEQYETLLRDLSSMNVLHLALSGGEPLAHPDFFRIGALARELGFVVRVKSNGHALSEALATRLRDEVDPFVVEVSLHGATAETHDRQTRVAGSFERLLRNIATMKLLGLRVKVNSTLTRWNENESEAMYEICDRLDVPLRFDLQVSPRDDGNREPMQIAPTAEGIRRLLAVDDERYRRFHGEDASRVSGRPLDDDDIPAPPDKHCGAGSAALAIDPYGNVYPCVQWRRPVANLHETTVRELWERSAELQRVRRDTGEAKQVVAAHEHGQLLNFCPGLAELLTGSATTVPRELEERADVIAGRTPRS